MRHDKIIPISNTENYPLRDQTFKHPEILFCLVFSMIIYCKSLNVSNENDENRYSKNPEN